MHGSRTREGNAEKGKEKGREEAKGEERRGKARGRKGWEKVKGKGWREGKAREGKGREGKGRRKGKKENKKIHFIFVIDGFTGIAGAKKEGIIGNRKSRYSYQSEASIINQTQQWKIETNYLTIQ